MIFRFLRYELRESHQWFFLICSIFSFETYELIDIFMEKRKLLNQNLDLARTSFFAKILIEKTLGSGSFSVGNLLPKIKNCFI